MSIRVLGLACTLLPCALAFAQPAADTARGEEVYARCQACHALAFDRVGPRHCGLFGRRAGSVPGFVYSTAMQRSGIVWSRQALDTFLAKPTTVVPGTAMTYDGIADARERADLIAYLQRATADAACRTQALR
jgi:cytochrome c